MFLTDTGTVNVVVVPLPSSPSLLYPQQSTWLVDNRAQKLPPRPSALVSRMTVLALVMRWTITGTSELVVVPLPSSPSPLYPQQSTRPVDSRAQELPLLAWLATAVALVIPSTPAGTSEFVVVLLPSSP